MNKILIADKIAGATLVLAAALALNFAKPVVAASFGEPATVFYGTVTGTGSLQPFAVTQGDILWTIRRSDGVELTLKTRIYPLNGGAISYRLDVPHEAWAYGLTGSTSSIPLTASASTNETIRITVAGVPARLAQPARDVFAVAQVSRAATYRLDLEVPLVATDSDGDGMPDWWENKYALDLQNGLDAALDADGDGRSNLQEYLDGTDPRQDGRIPSLVTLEVRAYAGSSTGVRLLTLDMDTPASALVYTLESCPAQGTLKLRNGVAAGAASDVTLTGGAVFTQADVDSGRLIYVAPRDLSASGARFEVSVRDEDQAHPAARGVVALTAYDPGTGLDSLDLSPLAPGLTPQIPVLPEVAMDEQLRMELSWLGRNLNYVVWDSEAESRGLVAALPSSGLSLTAYTNQYVPQYGVDRRQILWGGRGSDRLTGGMEGDVLIGGPGVDILRGNGGSDLFMVTDPSDGNDIIQDFSLTEHDVLDVSRVLQGPPGMVTNFVHLTVSGTNTLVGINFSGAGRDFTNMVVTFSGLTLTPDKLSTLVKEGNLVCGNKVLATQVAIVASLPSASENGPVSGAFTVSRVGSLDSDLMVNLQISGSAVNGVDYALLNSTIVIPAGAASVSIPVDPYVDTLSELKEVVQVNVLAGTGYEVGTAVAQVTIDDLAPLLSVEALEPTAVKSTLTPGVFLINRSGLLNRSVVVRLKIGGTAANGTDYSGVPTYVNMASEQATALITVTPKPGAFLSYGAESVDLSILPDTTYCVWAPSSARVMIVDELLTMAAWKDRNFSLSAVDVQTFAQKDTGLTGINNLQRYAFGLDPINPQGSDGIPRYEVDGNRLTVSFRKPLSVTDVDYAAEMSRDLVSWYSGPTYFEEFTHPDFTGRYDMVSYRVRQPLTNSLPLFMRIRLDFNP